MPATPSRGGYGRPLRVTGSILTPLLALGLAFALWGGDLLSKLGEQPNISQSVTSVPCDDAPDKASDFAYAINKALASPPDYDGVRAFGLTTPINPGEIATFRQTLTKRQQEMNDRATAASNGTCQDVAIAAPSPNDSPVSCPAQYVQRPDPNREQRFVSTGVGSTADIVNATARDARYLSFMAHELGLSNSGVLLASGGKCLSSEGQKLHKQVVATLTSATVDLNSMAPVSYYNTGMHNGRAVVDAQPGIKGNRAAIRYTLTNGSSLVIMKRCGNVVLPHKGKLPPGPTDQTPPPTHTTSPSTTTQPPSTTTTPYKCPPGEHPNSHGVCIEKKDPDQEPIKGGGNGGNNPRPSRDPEPSLTQPPRAYTTPPPPTKQTVTRTTPPVQTSAPKPSTPQQTCTVKLGVEDCK